MTSEDLVRLEDRLTQGAPQYLEQFNNYIERLKKGQHSFTEICSQSIADVGIIYNAFADGDVNEDITARLTNMKKKVGDVNGQMDTCLGEIKEAKNKHFLDASASWNVASCKWGSDKWGYVHVWNGKRLGLFFEESRLHQISGACLGVGGIGTIGCLAAAPIAVPIAGGVTVLAGIVHGFTGRDYRKMSDVETKAAQVTSQLLAICRPEAEMRGKILFHIDLLQNSVDDWGKLKASQRTRDEQLDRCNKALKTLFYAFAEYLVFQAVTQIFPYPVHMANILGSEVYEDIKEQIHNMMAAQVAAPQVLAPVTSPGIEGAAAAEPAVPAAIPEAAVAAEMDV